MRTDGVLLIVGDRLAVTFQRTLRIPDDAGEYPLPPGLGPLPVAAVADLTGYLPARWRELGGVVIPLYQREALWLGFRADPQRPVAVQVGVGGVNALTGTWWDEGLSDAPTNYLVCPHQPWLDGVNVGAGVIRQFVAMPFGRGDTVEGQLAGEETMGGLQFSYVHDPA